MLMNNGMNVTTITLDEYTQGFGHIWKYIQYK